MDVLLAIHHPDLRLAIDLYLREEPGINVVGMASETEGLSALLNTLRPDLLLIDWSLPGRPLVQVLAEGQEPDPPPKIIVLGADDRDMKAALAAKADYFVVKGESPEQLLSAIRHVSSRTGSAAAEGDS